jgi:hypothetical protein
MKRKEFEGRSNIRRLKIGKSIVGSLAILTGLLVSVAAELTPVNGEVRVAGGLPGDQSNPAVAGSPEGGFMVWEDNSVTPLGMRIKGIQIDSQFQPIGNPFVLSSAYKSKATGDQSRPRIATFPDGSAVVVWQQAGLGKKAASQVFARFFSALGKPMKSDIRVGNSPKSNERDPSVAVLSNGGVVVVWSAFDLDGSMDGVFAQLFSPAGKKIGKPFRVNEHTVLNQRQPDVAALPDDGFVVAWTSELQSSASSIDVYARHFYSTGLPAAGEFRVSQTTSNACANPAVVSFADGGFAVFWSQRDDILSLASSSGVKARTRSANGWDVYGRHLPPALVYSSSHTAPNAFRVNSNSYGDQFAPRAATAGSNCMVVWTSLGQDGSYEGIYGQLLSSSGAFQGGELKLNSTTLGPQIHPAVASNGDAGYISVWSSLTGSSGFPISVNFDIFAQVYLQSSGL